MLAPMAVAVPAGMQEASLALLLFSQVARQYQGTAHPTPVLRQDPKIESGRARTPLVEGEGARSHARKGIKNPAPLTNQCDL